MTEKKKHVSLTLIGRVQGVGFRYSAVQKAQEHNIKGFVKNQPDGSVYIEAEGEETDLEHFMYWCEKGPSSARVNHVSKQEKPIQNYPSFSVKH